jgi:hypothetical protein
MPLTETMIDHMQGVGESNSLLFAGAGWTNGSGDRNITCGSWRALVDMTSGGRGWITTEGGGADELISWMWTDRATGYTGANGTLEASGYEGWVLRESTRQWVRLFGPSLLGEASYWNFGGNLGGNGGSYAQAIPLASGAYCRVPDSNDQFGLEFWSAGAFGPTTRNAGLIQDARAFHVRCLVRRARRDYAGADNRATQPWRCRIGYDILNSRAPGYSGGNAFVFRYTRPERIAEAQAAGDYTRAYPGYAQDGGTGKWVLVPYDAGSPDAWTMVSCTSIFPSAIRAGISSAWAVAAGVTPFSIPSVWSGPDWMISADEFRQNPVPDPGSSVIVTPPPVIVPPVVVPPAPITPGLPTEVRWFETLSGQDGATTIDLVSWSGSAGSAPIITTTTATAGVVGRSYLLQLSASGSPAPTFAVTTGSLPAGLVMTTSGIISGTPTTAATTNFTVTATNSAGSDPQAYSLVVTEEPDIATTALPTATVGTAYSTQLVAFGSTPITWALDSGAFPTGLSISTAGVISGTPSGAAGAYAVVVSATNAAGADTQALTVNMTGAPTITTSLLPLLLTGTAANITLTAAGASLTWTLQGTLPAGLSLSSGGVISGTPTTPGAYEFGVTATNASGASSAVYTGIVYTVPTITTTTLADGTEGVAYSVTLAATGSPAPVYAVTSGSLPAGLTLSAAGVLSGTPTAAGASSFTVTATNGGGSDPQALSLTIVAAPPGPGWTRLPRDAEVWVRVPRDA